ncbi:hypothetical protein CEY12_17360 [Chryseobacterium sp. T16E-39]|uniref:hypothetical protein n=1 Tax=Chryseobacterium sp. T16E-39 TaxID=2015076 RepID=UPI000B5B1C50|nr:hypothetical protein [Chryseobacterium sp. T16E-39]ASK31770.1 hypothetical protein CEY12_17360 [Chryseobacterium sp. T16E-39]
METKPTLEGDTATLSSPNTMTTAFIQELINNYRNNQLEAINSNLEMSDAHSIWFDLPKLKKFISTLEEEAKKVNPTTTENDLGIRFYYAAYPKAENWEIMENHTVPKEYAERHTLVMVPTMKKQDEKGHFLDYDFNPNSNGQAIAMALKSRSAEPTEEEGLAQNHGNLIPPDGVKIESY